MGYVTIVFPKDSSIDDEELKQVMKKARALGLGYDFTSSSLFVEWVSSETLAESLSKVLNEYHPKYLVEWREKI